MSKFRRGAYAALALAAIIAMVALARPVVSRAYSNLAMVVLYQRAHAVSWSSAGLGAEEALLARALALDAGNRAAHRGLGLVLWAQGAREEAGLHWRRGGIPVDDFLRVAWQLQQAEDDALAMEWYRRAMAAWPDASEPYIRAAILYEGAKDWEAALALYERALAAASFSSAWVERRAHEGRANALRNLGRTEEAIPDYEWLVVNAPNYYWGYVRLAEAVWQAQGDAQRAEGLYLQAIALDASNKWAYRGLAALYEETGRPVEAAATFRQVLELDPDDAIARRALERLAGKP